MTSPTPLAGALPPRDAASSHPCELMPATGPCAASAGAGALSWPPSMDDMRALVDAGKTRFEIAQLFGRPESTIDSFCVRHGLFVAPKTLRTCDFCGNDIPYEQRMGRARYDSLTACRDEHCQCKARNRRTALKRAENKTKPYQHRAEKPLVAVDNERVARLFAGLSFTDDPRAVEREGFLRMLPEPARSLTGSSGAMCAMARQT